MATKPAVAKKSAPKAPAKAAPKTAAATPVSKAASAKAASAKKPPPATTVAMKAVFEQLADSHDLSKQAQSLLAGMVETVTTHLKNGDRIRINGLGILEVRDREARTGRNPATGESIQIPASKKVAFRPAKELKDVV